MKQRIEAMAAEDQAVRKRLAGHSDAESTEIEADITHVDEYNLHAVRAIVAEHDVPTVQMIGPDGVRAFWLLIQHAAGDIALQERVLRAYAGKSASIPKDEIALLTDRILVERGHLQRYGTQFSQHDASLSLDPVEDASRLDERRRQMGLMPLADYKCVLGAMYQLDVR